VTGVQVNPSEVTVSPLVPERSARVAGLHVARSQRRGLLLLLDAKVLVALVVGLQIAAVVVFAAITIMRYPLWSPVDEGAHFDNIAYIAEHGSYPVLGKTLASEQELAIKQGVYPKHTTIDRRADVLADLSYEAFQPPLYYYVATPVFLLSGDYHTKAILLRFFGLFLLAASIALFARLSRHVLKERWLLGLAGGLLIFLMPGVIVRMVTISNLNLALPLAILTVTELWITWERRSSRRLLLCGLLVGCSILTDLFLIELVPVFVLAAVAVLRRTRAVRDWISALSALIIAVLVLLPWVLFNENKYHSLVASALAKQEQLTTVNPRHLHDAIGQVPSQTVQTLFQPLLPEEWSNRLVGHSPLAYLGSILQILLIPGAIVLAVALGRRLISTGYWLLLAPWVANVFLCWYIDVGQQLGSGSMIARYTYPTLPFLGLFAVAAVLFLFRSIRPLMAVIGASSAFLVGLWIVLVPTIRG
jgi:4-amino-4-deoxy-L-arabinose transferase-like glycosyltransferase